MDKPNPFCLRLPRGLRGWTSLIYKVVLIAAMLPVLDGLQAIGRGNSDMLPGLATLAFGPVSYTHLDVYKRQEKRNHDEKGNEKLFFAYGGRSVGIGRDLLCRSLWRRKTCLLYTSRCLKNG